MHRADDHRRHKRPAIAVAHCQDGNLGIGRPGRVVAIRADARAIGHREPDLRRPRVAKRLHRRPDNAVLKLLDVSRIGLGDGRVALVAERIDGQRARMRVRGRNHHVGRWYARRLTKLSQIF